MLNLTPNQMFKVGFLLRCADEGLSEEETTERITMATQLMAGLEKQAGPIQAGVQGGLGIANLMKSLGLWGLVGSGLLGGGAGYALGSMTDEPVEPEEVKRQELIAAYKQYTDRVRRQLAQTRYRGSVPRMPQLAQE